MYKGYKIRIYPTKEQEELIWKHIYACRFVWNYMLGIQQERYKNGRINLNRYDLVKLLTPLKDQKEYLWLKDVSMGSLQTVCMDLYKAYISYFKKNNRHPNFKSKKTAKNSFPVCPDLRRFYFTENEVTIPKIGKVKIKQSYNGGEKMINPRISLHNGKWILSFSTKYENQVQNKLIDKSMGIDLGVKELAVVSYGNQKLVFHNINKSKRVKTLKNKLKYIQKVISRKYETNGNWKKTKGILKYETIAKEICYKLSNIRENYIHQTTHQLITLLPQRVIIEDLDVIKMMKDKYLAKYIGEQEFHEFIRQIKYKCKWNGIEFIQADRWYPSSKICSQCGYKNDKLKLSDRVYICNQCGLEIDRDYNAAINLMRYVPQTERCTA